MRAATLNGPVQHLAADKMEADAISYSAALKVHRTEQRTRVATRIKPALSHGKCQSVGDCHQLQCGNQCLREGTRVATRTGLAQHHRKRIPLATLRQFGRARTTIVATHIGPAQRNDSRQSGSECPLLQGGTYCAREGTRMATRIGPTLHHGNGHSGTNAISPSAALNACEKGQSGRCTATWQPPKWKRMPPATVRQLLRAERD